MPAVVFSNATLFRSPTLTLELNLTLFGTKRHGVHDESLRDLRYGGPAEAPPEVWMAIRGVTIDDGRVRQFRVRW